MIQVKFNTGIVMCLRKMMVVYLLISTEHFLWSVLGLAGCYSFLALTQKVTLFLENLIAMLEWEYQLCGDLYHAGRI